MRDSIVCSMNLRSEGHEFLIREVQVCSWNKGRYVMDYDMPELVVFVYEDHHQHFVKDICIDRVDSTEGNCFDTNTNSGGDSNGSEFDPQHPCIKDVVKTCDLGDLMMMEGEMEFGIGYENSIGHPTKKRTSEALGEIFKKEDYYSRSFSLKHWQINSFSATVGSRKVEFPYSADYQPFPKATIMSRPHKRNIPQSQTKSDAVVAFATKSGKASSDQTNGSSISSTTNSFSFPILSPEWKGSPVRMVEANRVQQSRKHQGRKICFPCCKF